MNSETDATKLAVLSSEVSTLKIGMSQISIKLDQIDTKLDKADGMLSLVRWLGLSGVTIAVVALLRAFGAPL